MASTIDDALMRLLAAHADLDRLTAEVLKARRARREAAQELIDAGLGPTWIGRQIGVTPQAVQSLLTPRPRPR